MVQEALTPNVSDPCMVIVLEMLEGESLPGMASALRRSSRRSGDQACGHYPEVCPETS